VDRLVLYCKSYHGDLERVIVLKESIVRYNRDKLKFYLSVPRQDLALFGQVLGTQDITILADEDSAVLNLGFGFLEQQLIKASFWKLNLCEHYV
jgi:hypothetical protein